MSCNPTRDPTDDQLHAHAPPGGIHAQSRTLEPVQQRQLTEASGTQGQARREQHGAGRETPRPGPVTTLRTFERLVGLFRSPGGPGPAQELP